MTSRRAYIAGVPVDLVTMRQALNVAGDFLHGHTGRLIVTPNPEMAVLADRNPEFAKTLASADLALCDGFGLKLAAGLWNVEVPEVIHVADFALALAETCALEGKRLYLLGGEDDVPARAARFLRERLPNLDVVSAELGPISFIEGRWLQDPRLVELIAAVHPDVLFVALGHGKQEPWILAHLPRLSSVRIAMGIGGTLDYWSGKAKRPPRLMRSAHLEWLWRLLMDPQARAKRIFDAVIVFPYLALKKRLFPLH